jgi:hypothetical protein
MSDSDASLVARTLGGDLTAYAALMARYRDKFGRYAFHMLGNREDAQEAVAGELPATRAVRRLALPNRRQPLPDRSAAAPTRPAVRRRSPG